jgi:hypothetical protein
MHGDSASRCRTGYKKPYMLPTSIFFKDLVAFVFRFLTLNLGLETPVWFTIVLFCSGNNLNNT